MQKCNIAGAWWQHLQGRGPGRHQHRPQGPDRARGSHADQVDLHRVGVHHRFTRGDSGAVELLNLLHKLHRIDDGRLRAPETTRRIGDVLTRLEAVPCSVKAVVGAAPRLIGDLGFDRAIVSGILDGVWISPGVFIADDPQWAEMINRIGQEQPQTLTPSLFETEVVRRRESAPRVLNRAPRSARTCRPDAR